MQDWIPDFERSGLRIMALTTDSPQKNLRVATRLRLSISILSDPDGRILKQIGMYDSRWDIASYGYYLLGPDLSVITHHRGSWETTPQAKAFFLQKAGAWGKKSS